VSNRKVLVTGSSRGIGAAIARAFAAAGDIVAVHHRDSAELAGQVVSQLEGTGHIVVRADMADPAAVRQMIDAAAGHLGGLDVLVNNAAVFHRRGDDVHPVSGLSYDEWQELWAATIGPNLIGAANACWCAAQHMIPAGGGRIVNVSSRGAFRGEPQQPAYGASKAGLNSLGQSLAVALAPYNITVSAVAPGFVETDMAAAHLTGERGAAIRAQSPFNRVATPDEVAAAVVFLASPEAAWATGSILDLNGASYLRT
jgi:3-oxoacyl-[acyl-carrier protein] reductase